MNTYYPSNHEDYRESFIDNMRDTLAAPYSQLPTEQVADILYSSLKDMSLVEREAFAELSLRYADESFKSFFRKVKKGTGKLIKKAAPFIAPIAKIVAPIAGTIIGGPIGGAAASKLVSLLGPSGRKNTSRSLVLPNVSRAVSPISNIARSALPMQGNQAATKLMTLLANPQLNQALLGQILGQFGNNNALIQPQGRPQSIPFGALMNTLSEVALRAAEESIQTDNYAMDMMEFNTGSLENQADMVMGLLTEDYEAQLHEWNNAYEVGERFDEEFEEEDAFDDMTEWLLEARLIR